MYISELELHGFKSFAHKTKVKFDSGITAVVGPNGCGKSNIVDALRWVLGEQRPSLLRSSAMSNVIFNGTAKKKALGMSEVSLTFVNNKGILPTEYSEVTITRRLFRSGDSEYLINNTPCRLKDIMDLFMDTGMGSDAYSVIELKMVEEILNDRNNDRRRLFEEAAGVTRYKDKRKQTIRKLDETFKDLQRLDDILIEVRKKARSLEIQAEKAGKARKFKIELEQLEKAYNRIEHNNIQEELKPLQTRIDNAEKEKKEITSKLEELEALEDKARQDLLDKERLQAESQRLVSQVHGAIRDMETNLRIAREKISNEQGVIKQYEKDVEQGTQDLTGLQELKDNSKNKLEGFSSELEKSEKSLNDSRQRFAEVQQQYSKERHELYELEIQFSDTNSKLTELQTQRIKLESRLENTGDDLKRILRDISDLEEEIENQKGELGLAEKKLAEINQSVEEHKEEIQKAISKRTELESLREVLRESVRSYKSRIEAIESEAELLEELSRSKDAFPQSVSYLMDTHSSVFSMLEIVGNVFHTNEKHAAALEAALGQALNFVIVPTLDDAKKAAGFLRDNKKGHATFVPIKELNKSYPVEKGSVLEVVKCEKEFRTLAELLLGTTLLAETVDDATARLKNGGTAAVTMGGEMVSSHKFYQGGSKSKQAGARLGLKDKLDKLSAENKKISGDLTQAEKKLSETDAQITALDLTKNRQSLQETELEARKIEQNISRIQSGIQVYKKNIEDLTNRKTGISSSEDTAKVELDTLYPEQKTLQAAIVDLDKKQNEKKTILQKLEEERAIAQNRFNDAQLKHQDIKNKADNIEKEIRRAESGIENLKSRLQTRKDLMEESRKRITEFEKSIEQTDKQLGIKREEKLEADQNLKLAEEAAAMQRGRINEQDKELRELRRRKEVNMELVHHLTMAREKFEMQAQSLADHIWETYGVLMKQLEDDLPEGITAPEAKERIATLRQRLNQIGEVNPLAIDEFREEKERLDFYEIQIDDLRQAEKQLRETIAEINETATERFNETFVKIRENFKIVFNTLFHEDDFCDLIIDEESEDPLEAKIEIKANPKGKRPSGINQLSGGEKTLTAIALLFAIYLVKPSPFCVLDEVDAPLDDANIERFSTMIKKFSTETQFIIITHNKKTMSKAEMMYGVTMPETGISRLVGVKLDEVAA